MYLHTQPKNRHINADKLQHFGTVSQRGHSPANPTLAVLFQVSILLSVFLCVCVFEARQQTVDSFSQLNVSKMLDPGHHMWWRPMVLVSLLAGLKPVHRTLTGTSLNAN